MITGKNMDEFDFNLQEKLDLAQLKND